MSNRTVTQRDTERGGAIGSTGAASAVAPIGATPCDTSAGTAVGTASAATFASLIVDSDSHEASVSENCTATFIVALLM